MDDVQRQSANFVTVLVGDEDGIVAVLQIRPTTEETPRNRIGRIHGSDVIRKFPAALVGNGSPIHEIEMIKWHLLLHTDALELHSCRRLLLRYESAAGLGPLGPGLLGLRPGRELRTLLHGALARVISHWLVDGHGLP